MPKITDLDSVISLDGNDVLPIVSKNNNNEDETMKIAVNAIGTKLLNSNEYGALNTTDKKIIGAINEVNTKASQFDNMTATASGSIATFDNGGDDIPVSEFECEIVAQQGSGTPSPSDPLPITGFSQADISVCGINLWNEDWEQGLYNNQGDKVAGTNAIRAKNPIPVKPNTEYRIVGLSGNRVCYYDVTGTFISTKTNVTTDTVPSNAYFMTFSTGTSYGGSYNNDISINYPSTDTQYHAYTGNLYTVSFGQTIYGGRLIYANGQWSIEATHKLAVFNGLESWSAFGSKGATTDLTDMLTVDEYTDGLVNWLPFSSSASELGIRLGANNKTIYCYQVINSIITGVTDVASWKTYLSNNNLEFTYPLATPVIIPITSATRVKTISGDNNIYSNTGDCELKYFTNKADSLAELIKAFVV